MLATLAILTATRGRGWVRWFISGCDINIIPSEPIEKIHCSTSIQPTEGNTETALGQIKLICTKTSEFAQKRKDGALKDKFRQFIWVLVMF